MDVSEIENEISRLEEAESNWGNVQKLSWLYTVRDHLCGKVGECGGSRFLKSVGGKDAILVMRVIDEMMEATQVLNPRLYESVLMRLDEL